MVHAQMDYAIAFRQAARCFLRDFSSGSASTSAFRHRRLRRRLRRSIHLPKASKYDRLCSVSNREAVEAIRSFNRFYTNVIGVIDRYILDSPFSLTEVRILWEIYHNQEYNARKIGAALQVDEGYLSRTISKLLRQGLINRHRSEEDARVYELSLSRKGEKTFLELNKRAAAAIESTISSLSDREVSEIVTCMGRIQEILRKDARRR